MSIENPQSIRTLIAIVRDHSASMRGIRKSAAEDYNKLVSELKRNAIEHSQDVIVSVFECGYENSASVRCVSENSAITALLPMDENLYIADGRGTPLFDSIGKAIETLQTSPYANEANTAFLVMVVTDGEENASLLYNSKNLSQKIKALQATDKWTFTIRAPKGYSRFIANDLGLFAGNIVEWETTSQGMEKSSIHTSSALGSYFTSRASGITSSSSFYANTTNLTAQSVSAALTDISSQLTTWTVQNDAEGHSIRQFVEQKLRDKMLKGAAFYKLVKGKKSADKVQESKQIIILNKITRVAYSGIAARQMIGLPLSGDVKVRPGELGDWEIFIQSTSVNRKLVAGTELLYWPQVGVSFK
jgi:hypothetical protein